MRHGGRVGRYRLGSILGAGGMAIVYRGEDSRDGHSVAVKVLADNLAADPELRERFLREANIARSLDHPNVVEVLDAGEADGRPYLVMELVEGASLAAVLAGGERLDEQRAVDVTLQLSSALAHAHALGVVHRDVKPANVLLGRDGGVKLADFGIARGLDDGTTLTSAGSVLGTVAYLSPEQARGAAVGPASDIWSLGMLVAEMTSGIRPDSGSPRDTHVPSRLGHVVARCLEPDPAQRPTADEVAALVLGSAEPTVARTRVLSAPTDGSTAPAERTTSRSRRIPVPARRTRALAAATVAALVVLAVLFVALAAGRRTSAGAPPVARTQTQSPRVQAQDLAAWLRAQAGG